MTNLSFGCAITMDMKRKWGDVSVRCAADASWRDKAIQHNRRSCKPELEHDHSCPGAPRSQS